MNNKEILADKICNHFLQECGAIISKKDYDYVLNSITMYLLDETSQLIGMAKRD